MGIWNYLSGSEKEKTQDHRQRKGPEEWGMAAGATSSLGWQAWLPRETPISRQVRIFSLDKPRCRRERELSPSSHQPKAQRDNKKNRRQRRLKAASEAQGPRPQMMDGASATCLCQKANPRCQASLSVSFSILPEHTVDPSIGPQAR